MRFKDFRLSILSEMKRRWKLQRDKQILRVDVRTAPFFIMLTVV